MRRLGIAIIASLLALSLTACGAGFNASTRQASLITDGAEATITSDGNNIKLRNLLVVETTEGAGVLVGTIVNSQPNEDALLGVSIHGIVATLTGTSALPEGAPIRFEGESANAKAVIQVLNAQAGSHVIVKMFFARAGEITVSVIVRGQRDSYSSITA